MLAFVVVACHDAIWFAQHVCKNTEYKSLTHPLTWKYIDITRVSEQYSNFELPRNQKYTTFPDRTNASSNMKRATSQNKVQHTTNLEVTMYTNLGVQQLINSNICNIYTCVQLAMYISSEMTKHGLPTMLNSYSAFWRWIYNYISVWFKNNRIHLQNYSFF